MVLAELVSHDDSAGCILSLTSLKVFMVERVTLQIEDSAFKLRVFAVNNRLLHFFARWVVSHDYNVSLLISMVYVETLNQEVLYSIGFAVTK